MNTLSGCKDVAAIDIDDFFVYQVFQRRVQQVVVALDLLQFGDVVTLFVCQQLENLLLVGSQLLFREIVAAVCDTDIALPAISRTLFTKIAQELSASAYLVVCRVADHLLYAFFVLFQSFFIDGRGEVYLLG